MIRLSHNFERENKMNTQYIITDPKITTLAINSIVNREEILEEMNTMYELNSHNPDFDIFTDSDVLCVELAEVTDIVQTETSCVIEHSKERLTIASLVL